MTGQEFKAGWAMLTAALGFEVAESQEAFYSSQLRGLGHDSIYDDGRSVGRTRLWKTRASQAGSSGLRLGRRKWTC